MDFRLLGPLEVAGEDGPLALGGTKQRSVLAMLLLHANQVLSTDRLMRATRVEDGILGDIRFDDNSDLVEGPFTIYRFTRNGPTVDRVVTVRATGGG